MKKSLIITATTLLLLTGCTEEKKEQKVEQETQIEIKQEVVIPVEEIKEKEIKKVDEKTTETKVDKAVEVKPEINIEEKIEEVKVVDAETMFKTCASCHGTKGEKEALGKSQAIAGWDVDRTIKALNGYKDGSYGGVMKGIMKPHVETKTPEQIEALADFISKL